MSINLSRRALAAAAAALVAAGIIGAPSPAMATFATSAIADNAEVHAVNSVGGQCKAFVNGVVAAVAGVSLSGYQQGFANAGAVPVSSLNDAVRGDIIQITPTGSNDGNAESLYLSHPNNTAYRLHTAIIRGPRNQDGTFNVIDSNYSNTNDELVRQHVLNLTTFANGSIVKIWRFGVATGGSSGNPRVVALDAAGVLSVKEGPINATWTTVSQGVVDYRVSSNRIAVLDGSGGLWVKEGPLNAVWQQVATGVSPGHFAVTNDMVAVQWGTDLSTKVGPLGATWNLTLNPVQDFQVSAGDHIAARMTDGRLLVQWGAVGSGWTNVATGFSDYGITDTMVAAVFGTDLQVKQAVGAPWGLVLNPVADFETSASNHIAGRMTSGGLNVQWGGVGAGWTGVATGYDAYAITDNRVGILQGGTVSIKEGGPTAVWQQVATGVVSFQLS